MSSEHFDELVLRRLGESQTGAARNLLLAQIPKITNHSLNECLNRLMDAGKVQRVYQAGLIRYSLVGTSRSSMAGSAATARRLAGNPTPRVTHRSATVSPSVPWAPPSMTPARAGATDFLACRSAGA